MKIINGTNWNRLSVAIAATSILGMATVMASTPPAALDPSPTPTPGYTEVMNDEPTPTPVATPGTETAVGSDLEGRVGGLEVRVTTVEQDVKTVKEAPQPSVTPKPSVTPAPTPKPHLDPCKFPDAASFYAAGGAPGEMCTAWPK